MRKEMKKYLIADTTKAERIALIRSWIPDPDSWNAAFSPWKADCDDRYFSGEGGQRYSVPGEKLLSLNMTRPENVFF